MDGAEGEGLARLPGFCFCKDSDGESALDPEGPAPCLPLWLRQLAGIPTTAALLEVERLMLKIAVYGKGGIGKSTITSNLSAAFASLGKKVIQIGCDPKADSTINLLGGKPLRPVMDYLREEDEDPESIEEISRRGFGDVLCIETGGPTPGLGCAGRGIIATFNLLEELRLFEQTQPDVVLYDVLGDVVCGGFAAPIREGYAQRVLIVTSGEKMALYAANNINSAVKNFEDRGYARVEGIILNRRNVPDELQKVKDFADGAGLRIVGVIPRSDEINHFEDQGKTVIEGDPSLPISQTFLDLAKRLLDEPANEPVCGIMSRQATVQTDPCGGCGEA